MEWSYCYAENVRMGMGLWILIYGYWNMDMGVWIWDYGYRIMNMGLWVGRNIDMLLCWIGKHGYGIMD